MSLHKQSKISPVDKLIDQVSKKARAEERRLIINFLYLERADALAERIKQGEHLEEYDPR